MYCVLNGESADKFDSVEFWDKFIQEIIKRSEEQGVGDIKDRMDTLATTFRLPVQYDQLEEFDGTNHEDAHRLGKLEFFTLHSLERILQVATDHYYARCRRETRCSKKI